MLAAQSAIFKQTSDAQGDFARTSDGMANSQRIAAAEFENAKAKLGEGLTPVITGAAKAATTLINVLDKIPGGTEALGVGILGVGTLSVIGGAVTTITGLRRAFTGVKTEALSTAAAEELVGDQAVIAGTKGSAALGKIGTAAKAVGGALAVVGIVETFNQIYNSARGLETKGTEALEDSRRPRGRFPRTSPVPLERSSQRSMRSLGSRTTRRPSARSSNRSAPSSSSLAKALFVTLSTSSRRSKRSRRPNPSPRSRSSSRQPGNRTTRSTATPPPTSKQTSSSTSGRSASGSPRRPRRSRPAPR